MVKESFEYPISEWIDPFKKAIWEIYSYDSTKIKGRSVSKFDIISKLQNLEIDIILSTIEKVIEKSKEERIDYPIAFIKTKLFNEIDEFSARVQAQFNYDFLDKKATHKKNKPKLTRFHNFEQRTDKYSAEELEDIIRKKRQEKTKKYKNKKDFMKKHKQSFTIRNIHAIMLLFKMKI